MKFFLIVMGLIVSAWILYSLVFRKAKHHTDKTCFLCGEESKYGYSNQRREGMKDIKSMCRKCLISQLEKDFGTFSGRAVIIQPAPGPPCYVFHSNEEWCKFFKESKMDEDATAYLLRMSPRCRDCGVRANFLWIESSGLTEHNFGNVLKKGFSETLLTRNPKPISLCGKCCVRHIARALETKEITYLEVSGPRGDEDGFVVPMAF